MFHKQSRRKREGMSKMSYPKSLSTNKAANEWQTKSINRVTHKELQSQHDEHGISPLCHYSVILLVELCKENRTQGSRAQIRAIINSRAKEVKYRQLGPKKQRDSANERSAQNSQNRQSQQKPVRTNDLDIPSDKVLSRKHSKPFIQVVVQ